MGERVKKRAVEAATLRFRWSSLSFSFIAARKTLFSHPFLFSAPSPPGSSPCSSRAAPVASPDMIRHSAAAAAAAAARVGGGAMPLSLLAKKRRAGNGHAVVALAVPPSSSSSSSSPSPVQRDDADAVDDVYAARARSYQALARKPTTKMMAPDVVERRRRRQLYDVDGEDFDDGTSAAQTLRSGWFDLELSLLLFPILLVASPWLFAHPVALAVAGLSALTLPGSGRALQGLAREASALLSSSPSRRARGGAAAAAAPPPMTTLRDPSFDPRRRPPTPRRPSLPSGSAGSGPPAAPTAAATPRGRRSSGAGPPLPPQQKRQQQQRQQQQQQQQPR